MCNDTGQVNANDVQCLCVWLAEEDHYRNRNHRCSGSSDTYNWALGWLKVRLDPRSLSGIALVG